MDILIYKSMRRDKTPLSPCLYQGDYLNVVLYPVSAEDEA